MLPYLSGRYRAGVMDALFEHVGGFERAAAWIEKSDDNYGQFFRMWAAGAVKPTAEEATTNKTVSVEDLLARLDAGEHAKVINGEVVEGDT